MKRLLVPELSLPTIPACVSHGNKTSWSVGQETAIPRQEFSGRKCGSSSEPRTFCWQCSTGSLLSIQALERTRKLNRNENLEKKSDIFLQQHMDFSLVRVRENRGWGGLSSCSCPHSLPSSFCCHHTWSPEAPSHLSYLAEGWTNLHGSAETSLEFFKRSFARKQSKSKNRK